MSDQTAQTGTPGAAPIVNKLYFAAWRWHFYAGLYVIPFLLMLSVTGLVMLWFSTVQPEYGDKITLAPATTTLTLPQQEAAALAAVPGGLGIAEYVTPRSANTPALFTVATETAKTVLAVNPYSGEILRQTPKGGTWYALAEEIHGTLLMGDLGDRLIEIAASLGTLMLVTGVYLVWPRGQGGARAMFVPRLAAKGRALWKSLHQVVGTWTAVFLVFFLVSGLAWTGVWGAKFVQPWSSYPAQKWDAVPLSDQTHASLNGDGEKVVPWGLELTPLPRSGSAAGVAVLPEGAVLNLSSIVALGHKLGFGSEGRFHVTPPDDSTGVWTLSQDSMSYDSANPTIDRTVHVDQYTGRVLADVRYDDYSLMARAMAVGIALHEGQVGLWNLILNAVIVLGFVFLCVSGLVMWWKRRPAGALRLAAPPLPAEVPLARGVVLLAVLLSMAVPLLGLTLLAVLVFDLVILQTIPALKRVVA